MDTAEETPRKRGPKGPRKNLSPNFAEAVDNRSKRMAGAGRPLPIFPTTADELASQWKVGADDAYGVSIKLSRQRVGSQDVELVADIPLINYSLSSIAGKHGPGMYFISGSAGKYASNAARMFISEDFARECGFGRVPTTAADVKAIQTIERAAQGPTDPVDLMAALERMIDRKLRETQAPAMAQPQAPTMGDPFGNMGMMFKGFELFSAMQEKVLATAERQAAMLAGKMGLPTPEEPTGEESIMGMFTKIFTSDAGSAIVRRLMAHPAAAPQQVQHHPAPSAAPQQVQTIPPPQEAPAVRPNLSPEEVQAITPAVSMLQRFSDILVTAAAKDTRTPEDAADDLLGMLPSVIWESTVALDEAVQKHGLPVLGLIHKDMATDRWAALLKAVAAGIREALK